MKQTENCTGRGCDTHRLHQKEIGMIVLLVKYQGEGQDEDPDPASKRSC